MWPLDNRFTERHAREATRGRHDAGRGLWFCKAEDGSAFWEVRLTLRGERQDVRLGNYPDMTVVMARREAAKLSAFAGRGLNPDTEQERYRDAAARNLHQFYC